MITHFSKFFFVMVGLSSSSCIRKTMYVENFRQVFYECQNFGSISRRMENNGTLNYRCIAYIINALKFGYFCPDKPSAAHILNSLASQ
jgi:hypothetical protein